MADEPKTDDFEKNLEKYAAETIDPDVVAVKKKQAISLLKWEFFKVKFKIFRDIILMGTALITGTYTSFLYFFKEVKANRTVPKKVEEKVMAPASPKALHIQPHVMPTIPMTIEPNPISTASSSTPQYVQPVVIVICFGYLVYKAIRKLTGK